MKKLLLSTLTVCAITVNAQLPANDYAQYEFTQGSPSNTSASGAAGISGAYLSTSDRFGVSGNAVTPNANMNGANLGTSNVNNTTLCFWVKRSTLTSAVRIIQMYGAGGNGYRVEMDGTDIHINSQVESSAGSTGGTFPSPQGNGSGLDDDSWHHIAVRTKGVNANTSIQLELFVDGVQVMLGGALQQYWTPGGTIASFLKNATLVIDPLNGAYGGDIDDIYLYKDDLTNAEIVQIYNYPMSAAPIVNIPDANFKSYLVGNSAINTNSDTEVQVSEASAYSGSIVCSGNNIADLTGIEAFTSLTELYCNNNSLTSLDVTQNTALTTLRFNHNSISSIDVSNNTNLIELTCNNNMLGGLDVSNNAALTILQCHENFNITSLDVSNCTSIITLLANYNAITNLDVSMLSVMTQFSCDNNSLVSLNVANGNNTNITYFRAYTNPNLTCIEVDNASYSTTNWTNIDSQTSFSENCALAASVDDVESVEVLIYPNPTSRAVTFTTSETISSIEIYNLTGQKVAQFNNENSIDISNIPAGIYSVSIKTKSGKTTLKKLVKE